MSILRALAASALLLTSCSDADDEAPSAEDWIRIEGLANQTIWGWGFDHVGRPIAKVGEEVRRYSDADGWKRIATADGAACGGGGGQFRRAPGHVWITSVNGYFDLPEGSNTCTRVEKIVTATHTAAIAPNGDLYMQESTAIKYWDHAALTWSTILEGSDIVVPAHMYVAADNGVYFVGGNGIWRAERGGTAPVRVYNCDTKLAHNCLLTPRPFGEDNAGSIYFSQVKNQESINRVYKLAKGATDLTLVGQTSLPLNYPSQVHVTADGTVYLGGRKQNFATDYGEVFVFRNGSTEGKPFGKPPGQIGVSPDGTIYAFSVEAGHVYRLKR